MIISSNKIDKTMDSSQYCVLWNNYQSTLVDTLGNLQKDKFLTDITIVCQSGKKIDAHQLILSSCSNFFKDFLQLQVILNFFAVNFLVILYIVKIFEKLCVFLLCFPKIG